MNPSLILLVDDEKIVLDSLLTQLVELLPDGFDCETAESSAEVWEVLFDLNGRGAAISGAAAF